MNKNARIQVDADVEDQALKLYLKRQAQVDRPPAKPPKLKWLPSEAYFHLLIVVAALVVSAASTGPLFHRLESLFADSSIATGVAIAAILMLEIGFAANSYFEIHDDHRRQVQEVYEGKRQRVDIPDVSTWAKWGNFFPLVVVIVANFYARIEIIELSDDLKRGLDLIVVILTGLAAPVQLEIASHIIAVLHVRGLEDSKLAALNYEALTREWNEKYYTRFRDPRVYNEWVQKAAHAMRKNQNDVMIQTWEVDQVSVSATPLPLPSVYLSTPTDTDRQTSNGGYSRQTNAKTLVFQHLTQYPPDANLSSRALVQRIYEVWGEKIGNDSTNKYLKEWRALQPSPNGQVHQEMEVEID